MAERKKCVKIGRSGRKPSAKRYRAEMRWLKRQVARIERHIAAYPNDKTAPAALRRIEEATYVRPATLESYLPGTPGGRKE